MILVILFQLSIHVNAQNVLFSKVMRILVLPASVNKCQLLQFIFLHVGLEGCSWWQLTDHGTDDCIWDFLGLLFWNPPTTECICGGMSFSFKHTSRSKIRWKQEWGFFNKRYWVMHKWMIRQSMSSNLCGSPCGTDV